MEEINDDHVNMNPTTTSTPTYGTMNYSMPHFSYCKRSHILWVNLEVKLFPATLMNTKSWI